MDPRDRKPQADELSDRARSLGQAMRSVGALSTVGLSFVLAIVLGAWFGLLLDRWLGFDKLFFLIFFFLGLAAGILNVYRITSKFMK